MDAVMQAIRGLSYTTPKFTKIADYRLALFFHFLQVCCIIGVLLTMLLGKSYLQTEVPIGKGGVARAEGRGTIHDGAFQSMRAIVRLCGVDIKSEQQ